MAKLPFPTNDEYNPNPDVPPPLPGTATGTQPGTWFNVTRGIWTYKVPIDAIVCPPGGYQYYEAQDPLGTLCLNKYSPRVPEPDDAPIPRPEPTPPTPQVVNPTISYTPYVDPPDTFRAISVLQMYEWWPNTFGADWLFHVGVPHANATQKFWFRNQTVNTRLMVSFNVPSYMKLLGITNNRMEVPSLTTVEIEVAFDELNARDLSKTSTRNYANSLVIDVFPMNLTGPVFVSRGEFEAVGAAAQVIPRRNVPVDNKWWFNVTQNTYTSTKPDNAYICPPGSDQYYEAGDPKLDTCLANNSPTNTPAPPSSGAGGGIIVRPPVTVIPGT
jgi:hypothetical protein